MVGAPGGAVEGVGGHGWALGQARAHAIDDGATREGRGVAGGLYLSFAGCERRGTFKYLY